MWGMALCGCLRKVDKLLVYLMVGMAICGCLGKVDKLLEYLEPRRLNIEPSILQNYSLSLLFIDEFFD
jgi:hypothetical protein